MKLLRQPRNSNSCGQHCTAMVVGCSVDYASRIMKRRGLTSTKHLVKVLRYFKFKSPDQLERLKQGQSLPKFAILKVTFGKYSHWVVKNNRKIYDPAAGKFSLGDFLSAISPSGKITSFLEVKL